MEKLYADLSQQEKIIRLKEITLIFFKLGLIAFGGPAAHVALMEDEFVTKRNWISRSKFLDLISITHLIPGPNSTELALFIGLERGRGFGLLLAGFAFIFPAMALTMIFGFVYITYGSLPQLEGVMLAIKPAIIVIILSAILRLGKNIITSKERIFLVLFISLTYLLGVSEFFLLISSGIVFSIYLNRQSIKSKLFVVEPTSLSLIFLIFVKIGSILYGSGYVLLVFLERELIDRRGLLTMTQLIDSIAIGEFTPGPVLTTSSFIGYVLKGIPGGIVATIGIFLPSFVVVLLISKVVKNIRDSKMVSGFLDGVNVSSVVLMAFVTIKLASNSIVSPFTSIVFLAVFALKFKYKINSAYLVLGSGLVGYIVSLLWMHF